MCHSKGLRLCDQSCSGTGCQYNRRAVWTRLPCEVAVATLASADSSPQEAFAYQGVDRASYRDALEPAATSIPESGKLVVEGRQLVVGLMIVLGGLTMASLLIILRKSRRVHDFGCRHARRSSLLLRVN